MSKEKPHFRDFFCVWLGNFPPASTEADLQQALKCAGCNVYRVTMSARHPGKATGLLHSLEDAGKAVYQRITLGPASPPLAITFYTKERKAWTAAQQGKATRSAGGEKCSSLKIVWRKKARQQTEELPDPLGKQVIAEKKSDTDQSLDPLQHHRPQEDALTMLRDLRQARAAEEQRMQVAQAVVAPLQEEVKHLRLKLMQSEETAKQHRLRWRQTQKAAAQRCAKQHLCASQRSALSAAMQAWRCTVMKGHLVRALQQAEHTRMLAEDLRQQLAQASEALDGISKDLAELCVCPVSFQPLRQPVLATDLRTYEKDVIVKVLETNPVSPFTRAPMDKSLLRPNMLATELSQIMAKHFPQWEASIKLPGPDAEPPVSEDLLEALQEGSSEQALELLGGNVDLHTLNTGYTFQSVHMNLLQLCLCLELPEVACAVVDRPDFRRTESYSSEGLLSIHMAAAFNYAAVCRKIMADVGGYALKARTIRKTKLTDPWGRCETIPAGSTAEEIGRLFGHAPDWSKP